VLFVDDDIMVRQGLKAVLDAYADVELIGEAGNGEEGGTAGGPAAPHSGGDGH
jgi:YesN/AraC family two-component response regulator